MSLFYFCVCVVYPTCVYAHFFRKKLIYIESFARMKSSNITWSKKMQDAGIKVIFGVEGLKVPTVIRLVNI